MRARLAVAAVVVAFRLAGCGRDAPAPPADPFAAWDVPGRTAAWQGAHVAPGEAYGTWIALDVRGDRATVWDGATERTAAFEVTSPCTARLGDATLAYTVRGDLVVAGLGEAGARRDGEVIACIVDRVLTLDARGRCTEWRRDGAGYAGRPGQCRLEGDRLEATVDGYGYRLIADGAVLWSEQLAGAHSRELTDLAAAKAALAAR